MGGYSGSFKADQWAVLERVAAGAPLPELLEEIVRFIERQAPGMLCSIVLLDADRRCIRHGAAPSLPRDFIRMLDGLPIGPNAGSCGTAAYRGERVVAADIATHPAWNDYRHLALPYGLRACWSNPIFSPAKEVLGTFAMYYREIREPDEREMGWVDTATHLASIAILRARAEQSLLRSEARSRQLARLYAVSNAVNEAIVRMREPQALYDFACRIAVEQGLATLAWVGLYETAQQDIRPVARHGKESAYVDAIRLNLADDRMNKGPAARAIMTGVPALSNDVANDLDFYSQEAAARRGLKACAVFPLTIGGRSVGIFALYAESPHYFRDEEIRVLTTLAADISFAVESAATESERRRVAAAVRSSEKLRGFIHHSVADAIFYLAVEEPDRYRFLSVNPAFSATTGLSESEVVGKLVQEVVPEPSLTLVLSKYREAMSRREKVCWEEVTPYPTGLKHGEVTVSPIFDATGHCTNLVGTVHDVTQRRHAEAERLTLETQLLRAQKMEAIGNLTGGVAHDFNNWLGVIIGNLDLLRSRPLHGADAGELLSETMEAALRAADLTRRLLAFARRQPLRPEFIEVNTLVGEVVTLLRRTLGESIEFKLSLADGLWPVRADTAQLEAAIVNLATNGRDAMPNGGKLIIRTANAPLDEHYAAQHAELSAGDYVLIEVCDTGSGMPAAVQARIFEPFFTTKEPGKGSGLGLSMVFGFLKQSGGHINVYSEEGKGTCFRLYLPRTLTVADRQAVALIPAGPTRGGGEAVLVVEDNEMMRRIAVRQIGKLGYRTFEADNAVAALDLLRREKIDLLFTDIIMPGEMSGSALARAASANAPGLKILFTSGFPEARVETGGWLGANTRLLSKPYRNEELARVLRQVLDGQSDHRGRGSKFE